MRFLHTSDWHLGKVLRGRSRLAEQAAVMEEIVELATTERVDVVLVAGDVFESSAPTAEAQQLAWTTLLALRSTGAEVLVVAGNHDHAAAFDAVRPVFAALGITVAGSLARPDAGGVVVLHRGGEVARVALLPWLSPRGVVRAGQLMELEAHEVGASYTERVTRLLAALTAGFSAQEPGIEVLLAHAFVRGGRLGGGERDAQTVNEFGVSPSAFPPGLSYAALGHLHRSQQLPGPCPIWYPGSPISVDFGEEQDTKGVLLVEASPGKPAVVEALPMSRAVRLRTVKGDLRSLEERSPGWVGELLRVIVTEPGRAGLADDVRALLPDALEVRVERTDLAPTASAAADRHRRTPQDSFAAYLAGAGVDDPRLTGLFGDLLAEELGAARGEA